jgi:hypothetical protein
VRESEITGVQENENKNDDEKTTDDDPNNATITLENINETTRVSPIETYDDQGGEDTPQSA